MVKGLKVHGLLDVGQGPVSWGRVVQNDLIILLEGSKLRFDL